MWPFTRNRGKQTYESESTRALRDAEENLQDSLRDRGEVWEVSRAVRSELARNHISQRITILLKEGK